MSHTDTTLLTATPNSVRQPIDALVLDYGEVLCRPAAPEAMGRLATEAGLSLAEFEALYWRFREDYDRGVFDGPKYWARVSEELGRPWAAGQVARLIDEDVDMWTILDERMVAWVSASIDAGVKTALLSNMVPEIGARLKQTFTLLSRFTHLTLSCEVGSVKPEPAIYRHVLEGLGVPASRALLIDDRVVNIDAARALGMHGIVFNGYDPLMAELAERFALGSPGA
jgi:putative hydrolase of the HAD superfamily